MFVYFFGLFALGFTPLAILLCAIIMFKSPNSFKKCIWIYALSFGMVAYCYEPTYEIDLVRYFKQLDICRTLPFSEAFSWADDGLVAKNFIFWIISRMGDNHILPLLSVGTVYGIATYLAVKACEKSSFKVWYLLLVQLMLMPFYLIQSNVRNVTTFALIILAVHRDLVQNKRNIITILLYIIPCFIHMTGFVLVLFRIGLILMKKHPYLALGITLGIPTASIALYEKTGAIELPGNIGKIVSRAIWKAYASTVATSEYAVSKQESGYFNYSRFVMFFACGILLVILLTQLKNMTSQYYEFKVYCGLLLSIALIWNALGVVKYWVFAYAAIFACCPILVDFYAHKKVGDIKYRLIIGVFLPALMCARALLEIYYISKRIVMKEYLETFLTTNFWIVLWKAITHLF